MRNVVMIVDLQYGSTGKGQIAGTVGRNWQPDTVVCANGPNAGHTYRWNTFPDIKQEDSSTKMVERKIVHTVMPVGAVLPSVRNILIGPGAVIDIDKLKEEIHSCADLLLNRRLIIHPNASVVSQVHRDQEKSLVSIGSTMKGTAAAVVHKMQRPMSDAPIARNHRMQLELIYSGQGPERFKVYVDEGEYDAAVDSSSRLLVEGAQGASLSMHSRFYPYCTSRDVSVNQIWADCRLPALSQNFANRNDGYDVNIIGVCRTYPIRVANRFNDTGQQVGYSGDSYPDQEEIEWSRIGREPELTTVTKLPRRLFTFSTQQIIESVRYNAPTSVALTFCDYLPSHNPRHPGAGLGNYFVGPVGPGELIAPDVFSLVRRIEAAAGCSVDYLSYGPRDCDLYARNPWDRLRLSTALHLPSE